MKETGKENEDREAVLSHVNILLTRCIDTARSYILIPNFL